MRDIVVDRQRIDHAAACEGQSLLFLEISDLIGEPVAETMPAAIQEIGVKKRSDILRSNRSISDAALHGFNLDQGLKPEKTARSIAHEIEIEAALLGLRFDGGSDLVGAHREGSGIIAE